jgi:ATP-dependent exoDNAse (exonuclease V) beta subunit
MTDFERVPVEQLRWSCDPEAFDFETTEELEAFGEIIGQERAVEAYFSGEYEGMDANRVRVGTIHSAKGREADHVFVATDLTEKVVEQMAATVEQNDVAVPGVAEFPKHTTPAPTLTDY